jgi:hypothetical protein
MNCYYETWKQIIQKYVHSIHKKWVHVTNRGVSTGCGWRNVLQICRTAANIMNKQTQTAEKRWSSSLGVGHDTNNSSPYTLNNVTNIFTRSRTWTDPLVQHKFAQEMDRWRRLWMRLWTFTLHTMREISCIAQNLLASQEGLCSKELKLCTLCLAVRVWRTRRGCTEKSVHKFLHSILEPGTSEIQNYIHYSSIFFCSRHYCKYR